MPPVHQARGKADRRAQRREHDRRRSTSAAWRGWYALQAWRDLRLRVFERDGYVCQQTGALLYGVHPAGNSPTADHIVAHEGDPALFWDEGNVQTVSKRWHDTVKAREEAAERRDRRPD